MGSRLSRVQSGCQSKLGSEKNMDRAQAREGSRREKGREGKEEKEGSLDEANENGGKCKGMPVGGQMNEREIERERERENQSR